MINKNYILVPLIFILAISACYKDEVILDESEIITIEHPDIIVSGYIVGVVQDEFGNRLKNINAGFEELTYTISDNGLYFFKGSEVKQNGTQVLLNIEAEELRFIVKPFDKEVNYFRHTIFTSPNTYNGNSHEAVTIDLPDDYGMNISPGAYLEENSTYAGSIVIRSIVADLQNPIHHEALPGDHFAVDNSGNELWLDFKKIIRVDVKSENGLPLSFKSGMANLLLKNQDCQDCGIWKYDPGKNTWVEYISEYDINATDFSITESGFYCLGKASPYNLVQGSLFAGTVPLKNQPIDIYRQNKLLSRVYTTNNGRWFSYFPVNSEYSYKFRINCTDEFESGFQTEETELILPDFQIEEAAVSFVRIKGELRDCDDSLIDEHFLIIDMDEDSRFLFFDEAILDVTVVNCAREVIAVQNIDGHWAHKGPKLEYSAEEENIILNKSYACDKYGEGYFHLSINGEKKVFTVMESRKLDGRTKFIVYDRSNLISEIQILFSGSEPRMYQDNELNILFDQVEIGGIRYDIDCENSLDGCGFEIFEIEYYGEKKGAWIKGNFDGEFWVKSFDPLQVSYKRIKGDFLVPRTFS